jgi:hypothetical protein
MISQRKAGALDILDSFQLVEVDRGWRLKIDQREAFRKFLIRVIGFEYELYSWVFG